MTVLTKTVNENMVFYDAALTHRWYDAIGPDVFKLELKAPIAVQAANSLANMKTTLAGASTIADAPDVAGGGILITCVVGADNNGVNNHTVNEPLTFQYKYPAYFGIRFKTDDATQSTLWAGMGMADDDWHGGAPNDYVAFNKEDGATGVSFQVATGGTATTLAGIHTLADDTYVTLEMYFDGTNFNVYVNGSYAGAIAYTNANVPDSGEELAPTIECLTGDAGQVLWNIQWARWIQIQNATA